MMQTPKASNAPPAARRRSKGCSQASLSNPPVARDLLRRAMSAIVADPAQKLPVLPVDNTISAAERLEELLKQVEACQRCELGKTRTNAVLGSGSAESRLMFVGEAPGYHEDQQGIPFVGQAGKLLDKLLGRIGLTRSDVYVANVLKCRPPDNRDPLTAEIETCRPFLEEQISIIRPRVICTLGNFSTKLLSGKPDGISRIHGRPQEMPGHEGILLFPVYHPAAALYTPSNLKALEADFDQLPALLGEAKTQPQIDPSTVDPDAGVEMVEVQAEPEQLDLF